MHWFEVAVVAAVATTVVQPEPHHYHHHHRPGIGALAFVGGYLAGRRSHHHHHHGGCVGCGCGGCGGSCGWCGGGYYGRRRRRSLEDFLGDESIMEAYEKISSEDKDQCGLRLVCELAQSDPRDLAKDEVQILLPYRGAGESDGSVYGQYDEAAWHGQKGHACLEHYPLCAFTAQQIMDEYRKYSQERDDDGDTEESRV
ncbi:uncharacterized protein LOC126998866 [Eriocheir sinensis]|uniref:uncharacterized protein LOC126998866 n=1 Tax=Eriocheir sinensis TaxID=95602 RepID=UPI0021C6EC49|nr:uncharacterized protein LOC126998866 [Eriocheir sinensis]